MKFDSTDMISKGNMPGAPGAPKQDTNWLTQLNESAKNIKDVLSIMRDMRTPGPGIAPKQGLPSEGDVKTLVPGNQPSEIGNLLMLAVKFGFGDKPIGQIINQISPYTINQILAVMQKAGKNGNRPQQ